MQMAVRLQSIQRHGVSSMGIDSMLGDGWIGVWEYT